MMMSTTWLIIDFIFVFVAIAFVIVKFKLNPALALLLGSIFLGLTTGVSMEDVASGLTEGFGSMMAEVGLLISLGIITGFLMASYGAVQKIVNGILKMFGKRGSPYAFALTLTTITPPIFFDVLVVLISPIARRVADISKRPVASMGGPIAAGLAAGSSLVVPGPAMLAMLGVMKVPVGDMVLPAWGITLPCIALTTFLYVFIVEKFGWWDSSRDEEEGIDLGTIESEAVQDDKSLPMSVAVLPVLVILLLIVLRYIAPLLSFRTPVIDFLGNPVIALLVGTLTALAITISRSGLKSQSEVFNKALETVGTILVVTATAGSLGNIIIKSGMVDILKVLFEANPAIPLLVVWFVGAVFRLTVGGQMLGALTGIGIVAPLVDPLGLNPILVILAAGAGTLFGAQFTDNTFWMMKSMLGLSTRGTLKAFTLPQAMMSVVMLFAVLLVDIFV
jgi:H+/gluconate symporter-like permease